MKKARLEMDGGRAVVELKYTDPFGVPTVGVSVAGAEYRFVVDTGASILCITDRVAMAAGMDVGRSRYRFKNMRGRLQTTLVESLALGSIVLRRQQAVVLSADNTLFRALGVDGIVGGTILEHFVVSFDSRRHTVTLSTDRAGLREQPAAWEDLKLWRNLPLLRTVLRGGAGRATTALFDSGNGTGAVVIPTAKDFEKLIRHGAISDLEDGEGVASRMIGGLGAPSKLYRGRIEGLTLGSGTLGGIPVMSGGLAYPLLCWRLTDMGVLTLDYTARQYAFTPYPDARVWNMTPYPVMTAVENGRMTVASVWDRQLRRVISSGDVIESIGGQPVTNLSETATPNIDEMIARLTTPENRTVVVGDLSGVRHILPASLFIPSKTAEKTLSHMA